MVDAVVPDLFRAWEGGVIIIITVAIVGDVPIHRYAREHAGLRIAVAIVVRIREPDAVFVEDQRAVVIVDVAVAVAADGHKVIIWGTHNPRDGCRSYSVAVRVDIDSHSADRVRAIDRSIAVVVQAIADLHTAGVGLGGRVVAVVAVVDEAFRL